MNFTAVKELVKRIRGEVDNDRKVIEQVRAEIEEANKIVNEIGISGVYVKAVDDKWEQNGEAVFLIAGISLSTRRDYKNGKIEIQASGCPLASCENPATLALLYPFVPQLIDLARQKLNEAANSIRAERVDQCKS